MFFFSGTHVHLLFFIQYLLYLRISILFGFLEFNAERSTHSPLRTIRHCLALGCSTFSVALSSNTSQMAHSIIDPIDNFHRALLIRPILSPYITYREAFLAEPIRSAFIQVKQAWLLKPNDTLCDSRLFIRASDDSWIPVPAHQIRHTGPWIQEVLRLNPDAAVAISPVMEDTQRETQSEPQQSEQGASSRARTESTSTARPLPSTQQQQTRNVAGGSGPTGTPRNLNPEAVTWTPQPARAEADINAQSPFEGIEARISYSEAEGAPSEPVSACLRVIAFDDSVI